MRQIYLFVAFAALALSSACKSPSHKLDDFLKDGRYAEARALLEEEDVGAEVARNADSELIALRERYTADIDASTRQEVERLLGEGSTQQSHDLAKERLEYCPWSTEIAALLERCEGHLLAIRSLEESWTPILGSTDADASQARRFLEEIEPSRPWIMDSQQLRGFETAAISAIVLDWADQLERTDARLSNSDSDVMRSELQRIGLTKAELDELERAISVVARLPHAMDTNTNLSRVGIEALREAREALGKDGKVNCTSRLAPAVKAAWSAHALWMSEAMPVLLESPTVTYAEMAEAEEWVEIAVHGPAIRRSLALAHVRFAERRAPQGSAATLALIHLDRARQLGLQSGEARIEAAEQVALATLASAPRTEYRLDVEVGHKVEPEVRSLVLSELLLKLSSPVGSLAYLNAQSEDPELPRVIVTLDDAALVCDFTALKSVNSRFFSHYETVANPYKAIVKSQLDSAEWDVGSKERAYKSAVSSHNAWPTQSSLNSVNWAYTAYSAAVNNYNSIVGIYNVTPSTKSQPVYLPYVFKQGNVRFGWVAKATIRVDKDDPVNVERESVVSDFVRLGNNGGDEVESYRVVDTLDIDVSAGASLQHLADVIDLIKREMVLPLGTLTAEPIAELEPEEAAVLGWLHHPWGVQKDLAGRLGVPNWARQAPSLARLRPQSAPPPKLVIPESPVAIAAPLDPEGAAKSLAKFVCLVHSSGKQLESTGTGTLIGPDGLILTCAHVFSGPDLELEFSDGPWAGVYEGELVFVNAQCDVALVRAKRLTNDHWAGIRLEQSAAQGEAIIAIGNAAMGIGGQNVGGMSSGIVSNTRLVRGENLHMAADIAIAQGSSGGPLFALKDGALVGVVQAVANTPGIPDQGQGVAASGFLCLAAPAAMLGEWLGLQVLRE